MRLSLEHKQMKSKHDLIKRQNVSEQGPRIVSCLSGGMMRDRSVAIVVRDRKVLMVQVRYDGRNFWQAPGGGVEAGETAEEAALRELQEECNLLGEIIKPLSVATYPDGSRETSFLIRVSEEQDALKGFDPEFPLDDQPLQQVRWMALSELGEKDRAFLWQHGLMLVDGFWEEVCSWGDEISYPKGK